MLDAQLHYPVFIAPKSRGHQAPAPQREIKRVFRIGQSRPSGRQMGRR
jgi:hypothetical protein